MNANSIVNATPHALNFRFADSGEEFEVPAVAGQVLSARVVETHVGSRGEVEIVSTKFEKSPGSDEMLAKLESENPGRIIVGSLIAAQVWPGRVFSMVPTPGFERVEPSKKRMNPLKFNSF